MPVSLLLIEDNEDILANLYAYLEPLGYELDCARHGRTGLSMALEGRFDCIVLDVMLPGLDGVSLCRNLREEHHSAVPVLMLTARDTVADRVRGLEAGADDYLVKPFADLSLNNAEHRAVRQGRELRLSPSGFRILAELIRSAPALVRRETLEHLLWGDEAPEGSALRTHIHELRRELDKPFAVPLLQTVPHVGYRLSLAGETQA